MASAAEILLKLWQGSGTRLTDRLAGVSDTEFFWEPVPGCWTLRTQPGLEGRLNIDYELPEPLPTPFTTIAWRLAHLANGNWVYWEHAFGSGELTFPDLDVPGTAAGVTEYWWRSREPVSVWLQHASDADLDQLRGSHIGDPIPAAEVVMILINEEIHHGAEIGVLRDLWRCSTVNSPFDSPC